MAPSAAGRQNILLNTIRYNAAGTMNAPVFPAICIASEGRMNDNETCFICSRVDSHENFGVWFVGDRGFVIHLECWLAWYEQRMPRGRAPKHDSSPPSQHSEEAS